MDFGCLQFDSKDDARKVRRKLDTTASVTFPLACEADSTVVIVLLANRFSIIGYMPFGGNPTGRIYVGILCKGCFHLPREDLHFNYIAEKLNLGDPDAKAFAAFWSLMWKKNEMP